MILSDYGVLFCPDADAALDRLKVALDEALRVGVDTVMPAYRVASEYHASETGWWPRTVFATPGACTEMVTEINRLITDLNGLVASRGGVQVRPADAPEDMGSTIDKVKWIVVAGAVIAGVYAVGPLLREASRSAARKFSGHTRRRRRRR